MRKLEPNEWKHGTITAYSYHGCRCELCTTVNTVRSREKKYYNKNKGNTPRDKKRRERYYKILEIQNNCCAICHVRDVNFTIDHNHETELIRGALCQRCNTGLGQFSDSIDILERAVEYLKNPPANQYEGNLTWYKRAFKL